MQKYALFPVACALAVTSCADGHDKLAHSGHSQADDAVQMATVKPGANVAFSHEFVANPIVGGAQIVRLTIDEAYASGQLEVEVVKNEGVRILQTRKTVINLASGDRHTWDLQFETPDEGRFYISVLAKLDDGANSTAYRAYSVPVYVGDVSQYKREAEGFGLDETPEGQSIVTMDAQETIRQQPADDGGG